MADEHLSRWLQDHFDQEGMSKNSPSGNSLVDPSWELVDPTPDIHALFKVFNKSFFWCQLNGVELFWDRELSTAAGHCGYSEAERRCCIALSEPLLKFRPRKDLVETLLHEMIHAYLFVTHRQDTGDHGREFHQHMLRINRQTGANIKVTHNFYEEINYYFKYVWVCNGICRSRAPFYGVVKKTTDTPPGPDDYWWWEHFQTCRGNFIKVLPRCEKSKDTNINQVKITLKEQQCPVCAKKISDLNKHLQECLSEITSSIDFRLEECPACDGKVESSEFSSHLENCLLKLYDFFDCHMVECPLCDNKFEALFFDYHIHNCLNGFFQETKVPCPACGKSIPKTDLNAHLNDCLSDIFNVEIAQKNLKMIDCPLCLKKINESNIQKHVDICLKENDVHFKDNNF